MSFSFFQAVREVVQRTFSVKPNHTMGAGSKSVSDPFALPEHYTHAINDIAVEFKGIRDHDLFKSGTTDVIIANKYMPQREALEGKINPQHKPTEYTTRYARQRSYLTDLKIYMRTMQQEAREYLRNHEENLMRRYTKFIIYKNSSFVVDAGATAMRLLENYIHPYMFCIRSPFLRRHHLNQARAIKAMIEASDGQLTTTVMVKLYQIMAECPVKESSFLRRLYTIFYLCDRTVAPKVYRENCLGSATPAHS